MDKLLIYIGVFVGGLIGAYLPVIIFKVNSIGAVSIIFGAIGSLVGLVLAIKFKNGYLDN